IAVRPMSDAEVHVLRARLWRVMPKGRVPNARDLVKREVAEALARDPRGVDALLWQIRTTESPDERLKLARELTALHPDRSEGWRMLTLALYGSSELSTERHAAAIMAVQLAPDDPDALNELAWEYHLTGMPRTGLPLAQQAARLAPWSPPILDTWAALLSDVGSCAAAALVQKRAVDMLREGAPAKSRARYEAALARYESGCKREDAAPSATSSGASP
ncbi:MAG TPA: hypothetical protein VE549_08790, partial [Myxococcaceae bacterium]|nr:hypothetical protein [Myxococcaceae bacterium]